MRCRMLSGRVAAPSEQEMRGWLVQRQQELERSGTPLRWGGTCRTLPGPGFGPARSWVWSCQVLGLVLLCCSVQKEPTHSLRNALWRCTWLQALAHAEHGAVPIQPPARGAGGAGGAAAAVEGAALCCCR